MDEPIIQTPIPPPQKQNKINILIFAIIFLLLASTCFFAFQYVQLKKQISQIIPTPTPFTSPKPTVKADDPTANWKTYTNNQYGLKFKYPITFTLSEEQSSNATYIYLKTNNEELTFEIIKQETDNFLSHLPIKTSKNYNTIVWNFHEPSQYCDAGNCGPTSAGYTTRYEKYLISFILGKVGSTSIIPDQILSTFKFIEKPTSTPTKTTQNSRILTYHIPTGWTIVSDPTNRFTAAYDPKNSQLLETGSEGLNLTKKQLNNDEIGYKSYMSLKLFPYDGGSRHQFIYKYLSINLAPQKQDLGSDYSEIEYLYNNKSCLFLRGIYTSQMPNVWGMCDVGGGNAFLITSYDLDYETTIQTMKFLK